MTPLFTGAQLFWHSWSVVHFATQVPEPVSLGPVVPESLPGGGVPLSWPPPPASSSPPAPLTAGVSEAQPVRNNPAEATRATAIAATVFTRLYLAE